MTRATVLADGKPITIHIPLTFWNRGGRKLVVTPDGAEWAQRPRIDNAMEALARAFPWRRMLDGGAHRTLEELARARGVNATYVSRILHLTLRRYSRQRSSRRSWTGGRRRSYSWMIC
jgi:hypothetical protein